MLELKQTKLLWLPSSENKSSHYQPHTCIYMNQYVMKSVEKMNLQGIMINNNSIRTIM